MLADDIVFTYKNGNLASSTSSLSGNVSYTYDSNGNNTQGYGYENPINKTFDNNNALTKALPYWVYFAYIQFPDGYNQGVPLYPGSHNVVNFSTDSSNWAYSYTYDANHYPISSTLTAQSNSPQSFQYQYTQVN